MDSFLFSSSLHIDIFSFSCGNFSYTKAVVMRRMQILVSTLLLLANNGLAQSPGDSAAILEARAAFKMIARAPDSALAIAEKEIGEAGRSGDHRLGAFAHKTRGWAWMHKGYYDKAFADLQLAAQLFHQLHDTREEMYVYINLSLAYSNHSEFTSSARYLFIGDSLARQLGDLEAEGQVDRQMGILYRVQGQFRQAIPYFRKSMLEFWSLRDTLHFFDAALSLCIVYMSMSLPDSSLQLCNICFPLINAMQGVHYQKGIINERYGDVWFALANYEKAYVSYGNAYRIFAGDGDQADQAYEAMNLGKTLTRLRRYPDAGNYLLLSYRLNDSLQMSNYLPDVAAQLADMYRSTGDWRQAYNWQKKHDDLQDSLQLVAQNDKTSQLQAKYEADKKENEIALLRKDQQLTLAIVEKQKAVRNAAIVLAILLIFVSFLIISRYRVVHKARRLVDLEKMRNTIARDLHDDMGSALSSINIISKMALATSEGEKTNEQLRKIHQHSGLMLENMSDIVWTINPMNDSLEKVIFKMKEFAADIFDPLNIDHSFDEEGDLHHIKLGLQTRRDLYLVFKEAVNNAAKYSRCTKAAITIAGSEKEVSILVKDNGVGFSRDTVKAGNGLRNMEQRARQINGELTIESQPGRGTSVTLRVRSHD
jgi:signal transduction histidine kinase